MKKVFIPFVLWYLRVAAKLQLRKVKPTIIGVAGSSGKSSLANLLYEVIQDHTRVKSSSGKNSETGIPLHILGISMQDVSFSSWMRVLFLVPWQLLTNWEKYAVYIVEMGIDSPKEPKNMSYLLKIIQPTIAMVTNVALEHSVYFDPYIDAATEEERQQQILEMTAAQELLLLQSLPATGTAILNIDDAYINGSIPHIQAQKITISVQHTKADLSIEKITTSLDLFAMRLLWKGKVYELQIKQALPAFYAYEFLFALATALSLDIPLSRAIASLEKHFSLPPGRFSIFKGIHHSTILDSSYNNATLDPIMGILDMMRFIAGRRRKVAIIGDMRELGSQSKKNHELLAEKLAATMDEIILIGPLLKNYAAPILERKKTSYQSFTTFSQAKESILQTVREEDIVLVKGSQNTLFLERVVEMLLENKEDINNLCRRGVFWDKKRAAVA